MSGKNVLQELWRDSVRRSLSTSQAETSAEDDETASMAYGDKEKRQRRLSESVLPRRLSRADSMDAFRLVRHGSDPLQNNDFYGAQVRVGNFVKMGWLTKQGHMWKSWKSRFFVLFSDGTFAYYKSKTKKKIHGCIKLNDGVVSVQHVDIRKAGKAHVFQVEKGFYRLYCYCSSQLEAELWVTALRAVRKLPPPSFEMELTSYEGNSGANAVARHLNKIFVTDGEIVETVDELKALVATQQLKTTVQFMARLDDIIIERHQLTLYKDMELEMLPGNELVKIVRRHVEDRIFLPLYEAIYASLETPKLRARRSLATKNQKSLRSRPLAEFGIPDEITACCNWKRLQEMISNVDCFSLPTHKLEVIVTVGDEIVNSITRFHGYLFDVSDETISVIFRYVIVMSKLDDISILRVLLKAGYHHHPACQNKSNLVKAFLDAIKWIECHQSNDNEDQNDQLSLTASRVTVSISTKDIGIQFTTDGNTRGSIVYSIRRLSQAALSSTIVPGLALVAINDEPVILSSFHDVCQRARTAALPKRLTFMTEFYYYQLLTLDSEMYQYLFCLAAGRGDLDSLSWLRNCRVDINRLCVWEKTRGPHVFGFKPPASKGSALHSACFHGQYGVVRYLNGLNADANICNHKGQRPLHMVANTLEMAQIVEDLVDAGAEINACDREGLTPLMEMCRRGCLEGAATLLAMGADIKLAAWSNGFTALSFSIQAEDAELVELCLAKGADPNVPTYEGDTSLHLAASVGNSDIILRLLKHGANVNSQNRYGQTPATVLLALSPDGVNRDRYLMCLEILASAGYEFNKRDLYGRHIFHLASLWRDKRMSGLVSRFRSLSSGDDEMADMDLFGNSLNDYNDGTLWSSVFLDPRCMRNFLIKNVDEEGANDQPCGLDEMIHKMLREATVDLVDIVAFVVFLGTFSSLNEVMDRLKFHIHSFEKGQGLVRFFVILLLFKPSVLDSQEVLDRVHTTLAESIGLIKEKAQSLLQEYKCLYKGYFTRHGSDMYLRQYESIPSTLQEIFSSEGKIRKSFPKKLHRAVDPAKWAQHCTLLTHALFCSIPVEEFLPNASKRGHSPYFITSKKLFQHFSAYVINAVLVQDSAQERAAVILFFLEAADYCLSLHNYDTLAAILYALQSTAVQRLRRTLDCLSPSAKKQLNQLSLLSDKGCRELNRVMHKMSNPSMPYLGLYLQNFVGLYELPVFANPGLVNKKRLRRMGVLVVEILHRQAAQYSILFDSYIDKLIHVSLPYASDESRYTRSLELEPREAGAAPLGDRLSFSVEDLDIDNEVRESMGAEGTFGFRQWIRKQKVVHRHRARSSAQQAQYEWV